MVDKYKLTASLVKAFFDGYSSAIVDCHVTDVHEKYLPQTIKRTMLEHYEKIFPSFYQLIVSAMAAINFEDVDEAIALLRKASADKLSPEELMRRTCITEQLYQALVEEYKRNFGNLLDGRRETVQQHLLSYTHGEDTKSDEVDTEKAIRHTVRIAMHAYSQGLREANTGKVTLHQPTVYRIIAEAMGTLKLADEAQHYAKAKTVGDMFMRVCGSRHNLMVMHEAMNEVYEEIVERNGIIAPDDSSN